jgi:hypothetical protein
MSEAIEAAGTTLEIETGSGSAVATVTAAVGFPTIITKAAHGLSNGDVVTASAFAGASAALLNGNNYVVKNATTNTLALDVDTTGGTLTAANGTLTPVTWSAVGEIVDFDGPGGSGAVYQVTHLTSVAHEKRIGLPDEGQFTLNLNCVHTDAGQVAVAASRTARSLKNYRVTYSDDVTDTFTAYVLSFPKSGGLDDKVSRSLTLEISGAVTQA